MAAGQPGVPPGQSMIIYHPFQALARLLGQAFGFGHLAPEVALVNLFAWLKRKKTANG